MKSLFKLLITLLVLPLQFSCDSVGPDDNSNGIDTTSHNFIFQTWTFGTIGGSTLYDCAIISSENIWFVGEIMIADTSINGYTTYNAVHWDGSQWELKRIKTNACGGVDYPPIQAIFTFSFNDVLFAHIDGSITHYNGIEFTNDCSLITQLNGSANKIWGESNNDFYVVSSNGFIARYLNGTWSRINCGTSLNINDIWGITDEYGIKFILCPAYDFGSGGEKKLISISNNTVGEISWVQERELYTVWFNEREKIYAGGEGLFYRTNNQWKEETLPELFKFRVRGNGLNDIWTVGGYGFAAH